MSYYSLKIVHNKKEIFIFRDIEDISGFIINQWSEISRRTIESRGVFTVALSGGRTPVQVYERLAELKDTLYWSKTHVFLVDERFVPLEDAESNYNMLKRTLLSRVNIPAKNIHYISTDEASPQESARKYEMLMLSYFRIKDDELPRFDLILLGIGEDGHTASLFPDTPSLSKRKGLVITVSPPKTFRFERISLTLPVINNAENIIFLVTGSNKATVLRRIIKEGDRALPASMVQPVNGRLIFVIDEPSAELLSLK